MRKYLKNKIKKILWKIGVEIRKINNEVSYLSFDDIYKLKLNKSPTIFDIGANQGQSIERFKKIFFKPTIHAFEPIKFEFDKLKNKYQNDPNVILNNFAVGDVVDIKDFFITAKTGNSSFNKISKNTEWIKKRSRQYGTTVENYVQKIEKVEIITLDKYCNNSNINSIDLIKIDTQGYEDKVLEGSQNILSKGIVYAIESEIMLDNVYDKYLNFSDLEKNLIKNNFRIVGINLINNNLFTGLTFFGDVLYFNKKKFNL